MNIGDSVNWVNWDSSIGDLKERQGTIVEIVPAKQDPKECFASAAQKTGAKWDAYYSRCRDHESYIVHVPAKDGCGSGKLYWPALQFLRKVNA